MFPKSDGYVLAVNQPATGKNKGKGMESRVMASGNNMNLIYSLLALEITVQSRFGIPVEEVKKNLSQSK